MYFETDTPDCATFAWDQGVKLKIARAEWLERRREALAAAFKPSRIADMIVPAPKFNVPAGPVFSLPTMTNLSAPSMVSSSVVYGGNNLNWSKPSPQFSVPSNTWAPRSTSMNWLPVLASSVSSR